MQKIFLRYL